MVDRPKYPPPSRPISGCGREFPQGEWAITWNHGGGRIGSITFWYSEWDYDRRVYPGFPFRCGIPWGKNGNDTTYFCHSCLVKGGIIW